VRVFGEGAAYFARYKVAQIQRVCASAAPSRILDVGCGVGLLTELLGRAFPSSHVTGLECSDRSLEQARARCAGLPNVRLRAYDGQRLPEEVRGIELAVLANVLHHIPPAERLAFLAQVVRPALAPGARAVVFEQNPYNPLTQLIVRRSPIDRGARLLTRARVSRLLVEAGFTVLRRDYVVFFPRPLRAARGLEPRLGWLPLGGQYIVVARRAP
jgi:SAM-dependent methyltransferase